MNGKSLRYLSGDEKFVTPAEFVKAFIDYYKDNPDGFRYDTADAAAVYYYRLGAFLTCLEQLSEPYGNLTVQNVQAARAAAEDSLRGLRQKEEELGGESAQLLEANARLEEQQSRVSRQMDEIKAQLARKAGLEGELRRQQSILDSFDREDVNRLEAETKRLQEEIIRHGEQLQQARDTLAEKQEEIAACRAELMHWQEIDRTDPEEIRSQVEDLKEANREKERLYEQYRELAERFQAYREAWDYIRQTNDPLTTVQETLRDMNVSEDVLRQMATLSDEDWEAFCGNLSAVAGQEQAAVEVISRVDTELMEPAQRRVGAIKRFLGLFFARGDRKE